ncbi:MAG: PKD domain-containing protein [Deltaproteobacteria bacterium]|nr:PKD domain-containing protein [Deltaproteobacteria bacterium]
MQLRFFFKIMVLFVLFAAFSTTAQSAQPWPGVTIVFDDGYSSLNSLARPLFKSNNIVATTCPVVGSIGASGMVTWDGLRDLKSDGWEIGSHSLTHPDLTTLTPSQLDNELSQSKSLLETNLSIQVHTFAIPLGAYDQKVLSAIAQYYNFARNVNVPFSNNPLPPIPYTVNCLEILGSTTPQQVEDWIEAARIKGDWVVLTFHEIIQGDSDPQLDYSYGTNQLTTILQYIQTKGYPTPTFTSVFKQFPPTANAGANQTVNLGATATLNGDASSDPCAQSPLTFAWNFKSKPAESGVTLSGANTVNPSFTPDKEGDYVVQLQVTNSLGVMSQAATVTVSTSAPSNSPPVANAGSAQTVALGALVTLDGSLSSDPDGNPITYAWSITSKPDGSTAVLSDATLVKPSFTADKDGNYVLQLMVTDSNAAASTPATVIISTRNSAPVANAGPDQTSRHGATITLDGSRSFDPDADSINAIWSFTYKPAGSTAVLNNITYGNPSFTVDKAGIYVVQLIATDPKGAVSTPDTVTIVSQNSPPVANAGPPQTVTKGAVVTLDGSGSSDPDGDSLTYAWTFTSKPTGSTATLSDPTAAKPTFAADKTGNYVAQLIVTDSLGAVSGQANVTITSNLSGNYRLFWRNGATGQNAFWNMNGVTLTGTAMLPSVDAASGWQVLGVGDFNGDGERDLLWRNGLSGQNAVWYMNGGTLTGSALLPSLPPNSGWQIVGVADFNGDNKPDILWRHASGQNAVWYMNGVTLTGTASLPSVDPASGWQIVGVADFNADGKPDLLWRNGLTGQNALWYMNGVTLTGTAFLPSLPPNSGWQIVGVADFNGDGKPDLLWRNSLSGQNGFWYMDGVTLSGSAFITSLDAASGWVIQGRTTE